MLRDDAEDAAAAVLVVTVVRSGGIAGLRREWTAQPHDDEAETWRAMIEDCPWQEVTGPPDSHGADRFVWAIDARCDRAERSAHLGDADLTGPWRVLVDAVQSFAAPTR